MPRFDGTGPLGKGPMTGKGLGNCVVSGEQLEKLRKSGLAQPPGRGLGGGGRDRFGMGRMFGRRFW